MLIYNSKLRLFPGKLKSRCYGPYVVTNVYPHGALEVHSTEENQTFKVSGHRVKPYLEMNFKHRDEDVILQSVQYMAWDSHGLAEDYKLSTTWEVTQFLCSWLFSFQTPFFLIKKEKKKNHFLCFIFVFLSCHLVYIDAWPFELWFLRTCVFWGALPFATFLSSPSIVSLTTHWRQCVI